MASGVEGATEFHWMDGEMAQESEFQFLKEGYLNIAEAEGEGEVVGGKTPVSRDQSMKVGAFQSMWWANSFNFFDSTQQLTSILTTHSQLMCVHWHDS